MHNLIVVMFVVLGCGVLNAKVSEGTQKCMDELKTYKKGKKPEFDPVKAKKVCEKNKNSSAFLDCVSGSRRVLGNLKATVQFCEKKPSQAKLMCVRTLGGFKDGKKPVSAKKISQICEKTNGSEFLACLGSMQRPLGGKFSDALSFCKQKPNEVTQKCVREVASYKNKKGKQIVAGRKLAAICVANASDKFLECLGRNQNLNVCKSEKKSARDVASTKSKK